MINLEYIKSQLANMPEDALEKIFEFISFQRFRLGLYKDDTEYLMSIPGMTEKIIEGMNTPLSECIPLSEAWGDV